MTLKSYPSFIEDFEENSLFPIIILLHLTFQYLLFALTLLHLSNNASLTIEIIYVFNYKTLYSK
jgi:hypothetical protein